MIIHKKPKSTNFSKNLVATLEETAFYHTRRAAELLHPITPFVAAIEVATFVPVVLPMSVIQAMIDTKQVNREVEQTKTEEIARRFISKKVIENYLNAKKQDTQTKQKTEVQPALYDVLDKLPISKVKEILKHKNNQEKNVQR